jgi:hypothetical protein
MTLGDNIQLFGSNMRTVFLRKCILLHVLFPLRPYSLVSRHWYHRSTIINIAKQYIAHQVGMLLVIVVAVYSD